MTVLKLFSLKLAARKSGSGRFSSTRSISILEHHAFRYSPFNTVGADVVIDTSQSGFANIVAQETGSLGIDIIIDSVGGPLFADNLDMLAVKGRIVTVGRNGGELGEINLDEVANKRAQIIGVTFRTRTPQEAWRCFEVFVEDCIDGFADGSLRPVVDKTFEFDALHDAHTYMMSNQQVGKIVLVRD